VTALPLAPHIVQVNSRFLYDVCLSHALEWPSLTCQMLPTPSGADSKSQKERRLLLGTHTCENEQNYVLMVNVVLPEDDDEEEEMQEAATGENWHNEPTKSKGPRAKVEIVKRINHQGEVNRARYMPQNPSIIATKGPAAEVYVFDETKQPAKPPTDGSCTPLLKLTGHTKEGYGVCWNPMIAGRLVSGSDDSTVCVWDTEVCDISDASVIHI
jgi:histone-binding protein RBBP4